MWKTTSYYYYDGKYHTYTSEGFRLSKTTEISKKEFYAAIQGLDSNVSTITRIETFSKTEKIK